MARATSRIPLSRIARDPAVSAFLARGERDSGNAFAVPAETPTLEHVIDRILAEGRIGGRGGMFERAMRAARKAVQS